MPKIKLHEIPSTLREKLVSQGVDETNGHRRKGKDQSKKHTTLVKMCLDWLKLNRFLAWKNPTTGLKRTDKHGREFWAQSGERGHGDIVMIGVNGRHVEIECKTGSGRLSRYQKLRQRELKEAGAEYWIVRSVDELVKLTAPDAA